MRWLVFSALSALAGLSVLIGCTQIQTHDSLADLLKDRQTTTSTTKAGQESSAVPRESDGRLPPYTIEVLDVLTIQAAVKDRKTGTSGPLPDQPISSQFSVRTDGTVDLGVWGSMPVAGLSLNEASAAIRKHLANHPLATPSEDELVVDVDIHTTSKRYYVITEGPNKEEQVREFPLTGTETVLDAIAGVDGLVDMASKRSICLKRRTTKPGEPWETLPVDWHAITQNGVVRTNYQLQTGDRIYVTSK